MLTRRVNRRPDDMPLYATMARVRKGVYQIIIKAKATKRIVDIDELILPNKKAVKAFYARAYPTLTWGVPKPARKRANPKSKPDDKERLRRPSRSAQDNQTAREC